MCIRDSDHTEKWFVERLVELVTDSVRVHLRADVEVGSYVSGGVDSSLLAALGREVRPEGRFQGFNGRFLDSLDFDESRYAQALADEQNMQLHVADIGEDDFVDHIAKAVSYTHLRAHETVLDLVFRLLLEKKQIQINIYIYDVS